MSERKLSAREYLEQLQELDTKINQDLEDLEMLKVNACGVKGIDYSKDRVQTSCVGDALGNAVTRIITRNEQVNKEIDLFIDAKNQIIGEIRGLHVNNYIKVLHKVYVQFKTVSQAAEEMNMSYSHTIVLHNKALAMFEETYSDLHYLT